MKFLQNPYMEFGIENTTLDAVAKRLIATRLAHKKEKKEFAVWCGVSEQAWSNYENRRRRIEINTAIRVAVRANVDLDWIYRGVTMGLTGEMIEKLETGFEQVA